MRIIGGQFKGRRFNPPAKNWPTRPTTDIAKEGLFNILMNQFDFTELKVLDLELFVESIKQREIIISEVL